MHCVFMVALAAQRGHLARRRHCPPVRAIHLVAIRTTGTSPVVTEAKRVFHLPARATSFTGFRCRTNGYTAGPAYG